MRVEVAPDLAEAYAEALENYLRHLGEAALERAYELGRRSIESGQGLLDLVALHADALARALPAVVAERGYGPAAQDASRFLAEFLAPFEMALRGFRDANETLRRLNASLEERVHERTRELADAQRMYQRLVEEVPALIYTLVPEARAVLYVSPQVERLTGFDAGEWGFDLWLERIHPDDRDHVLDVWLRALDDGTPARVEYRLHARDGSLRWLRDEARAVETGGEVSALRGIAVDVTEARQLAEQVQQTQRLESIGRLAGGIAHDFNNLLSVILTNANLGLDGLEPGEPVFEDLSEIRDAALRARELTRQLLAFSQRQVLAPQVLSPNELIRGMERMLRRLIGEHVALELDLDEAVGAVRADPSQIEQVIMNLVVNARDALDGGGRVVIASRPLAVSRRAAPRPGVQPGDYVCISVIDDGAGMSAEVQARIFEPFFTTKGEGRGTGLGLATCLGIIEQSGGFIDVESALGEGTRFHVCLPLTDDATAAPRRARSPRARVRGRPAVILVAEDDGALRRATARVLRQAGHEVLSAPNAREALELLEAREGAVDLLLSDVVMPGMTGRELLSAVRARFPRVQVMLMTGYAGESLLPHLDAEPDVVVLHKPFELDVLLSKIREVLG